MPTPQFRTRSRQRLAVAVGRPILLGGHGVRDRNLPGYGLPWRQDSNMLYLVGDPGPGAYALIQPDGHTTVYRPPAHPDAALWEGEPETTADLRTRLGVDAVVDVDTLAGDVSGTRCATLAVADPEVNRALSGLTGTPLRFGQDAGDEALVDAIIHARRTKHDAEIAAMRVAAAATVQAHEAAMALTRPGVSERALHVAFQAVLAARQCTEGYDTILTQHGEVLHHHGHDASCEPGRMVLCDGGGEVRAHGYGVDVTRTWPVSGHWSGRQRAAYDAVLAAHRHAVDRCRPGVRYREIHDEASRVLATWLLDEGLIQGVSPDDAVALGGHAVFFPHGVGHLLGLDVHDLEAFGDRAAYPPGRSRDPLFGVSNLRLDLPLQSGWVVTIEPGFYVVPSILGDARLRERLGDTVAWDAAEAWLGFGGIRIEDDVLVTDDGPDVLTGALPTDGDVVASLVGRGLDLDALLAL